MCFLFFLVLFFLSSSLFSVSGAFACEFEFVAWDVEGEPEPEPEVVVVEEFKASRGANGRAETVGRHL
jgi:hypothetical protein